MWILLGNKTKVQKVPEGRVVERHCRPCGTVCTYVECDVRDEVSAFFVQVFAATQRRLVCLECGEDVALDEPAPAAAPARQRVDGARAEDLLAALKKKMGL